METVCVKVNCSIVCGVWRGVGAGVGRCVGDESDSGVCGQVGERLELEFVGRFVLINISKMKLMLILLTM